MIGRLLLYGSIVGIFWLMFWLFKKEENASKADADTADIAPFAMRPAADFEAEIRAKRWKSR